MSFQSNSHTPCDLDMQTKKKGKKPEDTTLQSHQIPTYQYHIPIQVNQTKLLSLYLYIYTHSSSTNITQIRKSESNKEWAISYKQPENCGF